MENIQQIIWDEQGNCIKLPENTPKDDIVIDAEKIIRTCAELSNMNNKDLFNLIMGINIKKISRYQIYTLVLLITKKYGIRGCDRLMVLFNKKNTTIRDILGNARKKSIFPSFDYKVLLENSAQKINVCLKDIHMTYLYKELRGFGDPIK